MPGPFQVEGGQGIPLRVTAAVSTHPNRMLSVDPIDVVDQISESGTCRGILHTPITTKAEAIPQGRQLSSLIFMSPLYNVS